MKLHRLLGKIEALTGPGGELSDGYYNLQMGPWLDEGDVLAGPLKMEGFVGTMYYQMFHPQHGIVWLPTNHLIEVKG